MRPGDIAKFKDLVSSPNLNGKYCEILTPLQKLTLPTSRGNMTAEWYGCEAITAVCDPNKIGPVNGYFLPKNLEHQPAITRRDVDLHLFGWTNE